MRPQPDAAAPACLGEDIASRGRANFVGRQRQIAQLLGLLDPAARALVVVVSGIGGSGKTTLLRYVDREFQDRGVPRLLLDLRGHRIEPAAIESACHAVLRQWRKTAPRRAVLMLDSVERLAPLETWLRDTFLPALPGFVRVILAGRWEPDAAWRNDPAWLDHFEICPLPDFSTEECLQYLGLRGVDVGLHQGLCELARGHPLALTLAAGMALQEPRPLSRLDRAPELTQLILERMIGHPDPDLLAALRVSALLRETTESALAAIARPGDARGLFDTLRQQAYVRCGSRGLRPQPLVREALLADLRWRSPELHRELVWRVCDHLMYVLAQDPASQRRERLLDCLFALHEDLCKPCANAEPSSLQVEQVKPADWPLIESLAVQCEGTQARHTVDYWRRRHAAAGHAVYDGAGHVQGFSLVLDRESIMDADAASDPMLVVLQRYLRGPCGLRSGGQLLVQRFTSTHARLPEDRATLAFLMGRFVEHSLVRSSIALTCSPLPARGQRWRTLVERCHVEPFPGTPRELGETNGLLIGREDHAGWPAGIAWHFSRGGAPPATPATVTADDGLHRFPGARFATEPLIQDPSRVGAALPRPIPTPRSPDYRHGPLLDVGSMPRECIASEEAAFRAAVVSFLHGLARRCPPTDHPLLYSQLVQMQSPRGAGVLDRNAALVRVLQSSSGELEQDGARGQVLHRVLQARYFRRAGKQQMAAASLNLSRATYRRRLAEALRRLGDRLWAAECLARRAASAADEPEMSQL